MGPACVDSKNSGQETTWSQELGATSLHDWPLCSRIKRKAMGDSSDLESFCMTFGSHRYWVMPAVIVCLAFFLLGAAAGSEPALVSVRIIVVATRGQALSIVEQLSKGVDFAALARENSTDSTAAEGGYMGKVDPGTLRAELREALRGLGPGQVSQVVKIPSGYAIIQVVPENASPLSTQPTPIDGFRYPAGEACVIRRLLGDSLKQRRRCKPFQNPPDGDRTYVRSVPLVSNRSLGSWNSCIAGWIQRGHLAPGLHPGRTRRSCNISSANWRRTRGKWTA